jgi:hypothetical protein
MYDNIFDIITTATLTTTTAEPSKFAVNADTPPHVELSRNINLYNDAQLCEKRGASPRSPRSPPS